jgi:GDPmannose 4,6-dehydratase
MSRRALVTGITGQDGYYLAELLLAKDYRVYGVLRPLSQHSGTTQNLERIAPLLARNGVERLTLSHVDLTDYPAIVRLIESVQPDEVYNLAGNSFVPDSWQHPLEAGDVMGLGVARLLEAIRTVNPAIRFCQAGSSEMFGRVDVEPQDETTPFRPRTPYGAAKAYAHWFVADYRERHGLFGCSAMAFNHESPLRNKRFVTRKVTDAAARIRRGLSDRLLLGNLDAERDWGFAGDYVRAMWMMLQQDRPDDYVIATGEKHSVRRLAELAFKRVGLDWRQYVEVDPALLRPDEASTRDTSTLRGDISKARRELGWSPSVPFDALVAMMVDADLARLS